MRRKNKESATENFTSAFAYGAVEGERKRVNSIYLSGEPSGVAIPNPLASRFRPTFIVSQGSRSFM